MRISIVGGGRWARTIAQVLASLTSPGDRILIHSSRNFTNIAGWIEQSELGDRLGATSSSPQFSAHDERPAAIIVANRASDHFAAALSALNAGVPVMVEKPIALPQRKISELIATAQTRNTILACSNVFLFARYFETFVRLVKNTPNASQVSFTWRDGLAEMRRGELKTYDGGLTLLDDVLPHIVPMLGGLGFPDLVLEDLTVQNGGAELTIQARSDRRTVTIDLARNSADRRRQISAGIGESVFALDFSEEPGVIRMSGASQTADPLWQSAPHPLATMLMTFLAAIDGERLDTRLSPSRALSAGALADAARERYIAHQIGWLRRHIGDPIDSALRYALTEFADGIDNSSETWPRLRSVSDLNILLSRSQLISEFGYSV